MRCIEININNVYITLSVRLTLTWDVLKYLRIALTVSKALWLTLTWDVLKFKEPISSIT